MLPTDRISQPWSMAIITRSRRNACKSCWFGAAMPSRAAYCTRRPVGPIILVIPMLLLENRPSLVVLQHVRQQTHPVAVTTETVVFINQRISNLSLRQQFKPAMKLQFPTLVYLLTPVGLCVRISCEEPNTSPADAVDAQDATMQVRSLVRHVIPVSMIDTSTKRFSMTMKRPLSMLIPKMHMLPLRVCGVSTATNRPARQV
mmetsp:Transcript_34293/g.69178  ORF Transcript_34293/g.69178 Transcript_34293/m.69178 type:complete len:202 (+) Transcript_34293:4219-4824(+)